MQSKGAAPAIHVRKRGFHLNGQLFREGKTGPGWVEDLMISIEAGGF